MRWSADIDSIDRPTRAAGQNCHCSRAASSSSCSMLPGLAIIPDGPRRSTLSTRALAVATMDSRTVRVAASWAVAVAVNNRPVARIANRRFICRPPCAVGSSARARFRSATPDFEPAERSRASVSILVPGAGARSRTRARHGIDCTCYLNRNPDAWWRTVSKALRRAAVVDVDEPGTRARRRAPDSGLP